MPNHYKGKLLMLSNLEEAAISLVQSDLVSQGFKASRSAAVRYCLHAVSRQIVATAAGVERLPSPATIATDPTVLAAAEEASQ